MMIDVLSDGQAGKRPAFAWLFGASDRLRDRRNRRAPGLSERRQALRVRRLIALGCVSGVFGR
jgi:hypothetical protein